MIDTESEEEMITPEQVENLDKIFDLRKRIETKEDLLKLAELVEDAFNDLPRAAPGSVLPVPAAEPAVTIDAVVDGDTIETSAGTVRIIGIDAPERGECGYDEASALVASLLRPGDAVVLQLPDGEDLTYCSIAEPLSPDRTWDN